MEEETVNIICVVAVFAPVSSLYCTTAYLAKAPMSCYSKLASSKLSKPQRSQQSQSKFHITSIFHIDSGNYKKVAEIFFSSVQIDLVLT